VLGLALVHRVLGDVGRQSRQDVRTLGVVDEQLETALLVIEGYGLGGWEVRASREELIGLNLFWLTLELIGDANWERIVLLDFEFGDLEQRAQHGSLK
jgi:hypothetical protein